jgi:anion-transporting  ArsA/GET3 family ATPase
MLGCDPVILDRLLDKRLLLVSGKGGVGKSVAGAALAVAAVERGRRTLLIEVDAPLEAARYLGGGDAGGTVKELRPGLSTVNLSAAAVMDEYVRRVVRLELLANRILESPIYRRFFAAAPGLPELMVLGKIMSLEEERLRWSRRPRYDLLIVDAPSTGHGLTFLKVPLAASAAVPVGPIGSNARRILALLRDPARCALVIVSNPEEMAVVEARWFHRLATREIGIECAAVLLNEAEVARFTHAEEAEILRLCAANAAGRLGRDADLASALGAARRQIGRRARTRLYQRRLSRAIDAPLVLLPYLYDDPIGPEGLGRLAASLEAA